MKKLYFPNLGIMLWMTIIILTILLASLSNIPVINHFIPRMDFALVFFASIYLSVAYWQLFVYGAFIDVLYGSPVGITPFILLLIATILSRFKTNLSKQSTARILIYFLITLIIANISKYLLFSINFAVKPELHFGGIIWGLIVNMLFYVMFHTFLYNKLYMKRYENK